MGADAGSAATITPQEPYPCLFAVCSIGGAGGRSKVSWGRDFLSLGSTSGLVRKTV